MWQVLIGKRKYYGTNDEYEYKYIQNQDGLTLIRQGIGRDKEEDFILSGKFGELRFFAERWNIEKDEPTDRYIVITKLTPKRWNLDKETNEKFILAHAKDIESALINFPPSRYFNEKPIEEVLFEISVGGERRHLVRAEEIA